MATYSKSPSISSAIEITNYTVNNTLQTLMTIPGNSYAIVQIMFSEQSGSGGLVFKVGSAYLFNNHVPFGSIYGTGGTAFNIITGIYIGPGQAITAQTTGGYSMKVNISGASFINNA